MSFVVAYRCKSLDEIAEHFEERARALRERSESPHTTKKDALVTQGEIAAWESAARILRGTTLDK